MASFHKKSSSKGAPAAPAVAAPPPPRSMAADDDEDTAPAGRTTKESASSRPSSAKASSSKAGSSSSSSGGSSSSSLVSSKAPAGAAAGAGSSAAAAPEPPLGPSSASERKVIVVLEQASLESVKTKRGFELLNCDEHVGLLRKNGRDPASARPDICHQLMLALMDSPLNKAGHLQIFIQTTDNILIEVNPATRIPRTFPRFAGLMVQLLHKLRVRAADSSETLMRVIKNPVTAHLPPDSIVVGLEAGARLVDALDLPKIIYSAAAKASSSSSSSKGGSSSSSSSSSRPVVFVIGAMSHGDIKSDFITETFSISRYPLSAACAVGKLLNAFEHYWGVL